MTRTKSILCRLQVRRAAIHQFFIPSSLGNTSGPPAKMIITGIYMGMSTNVYEILIVEGIHVDEPLFTWRKYALGHRDGGGPYHHCKKLLSLSPIELEAGIFVSWNANSGQSSGDTWRFIAHAGDTFPMATRK